MARKKRNDRNHVLYLLTCITTGDRYVGLTVSAGRAFQRSAKNRWRAHVRNATEYGHDTLLYRAMREHGVDSFRQEVLHIVRGKQQAHDLERLLISRMQPELNMEGLGRKKKRAAAV